MREFNVDANVGRPQVAYRETITKPVRRSRAVSSARPAAAASTARLHRRGADGAGWGLRVPRPDRRRQDPQGIHPVRRSSASRRPWSRASSPATRSSTFVSRSSTARTTTSTRARWRSRSPARWRSRRDAAGQARAARAGDGRRGRAPEDYLGDVMGDLNARRGHVEGPRAPRQRR